MNVGLLNFPPSPLTQVAAVVGAVAQLEGEEEPEPEVWYLVVIKKTKNNITGQYLELDDDSPGGYTLHQESGVFAMETMCFSFGPLEFIKSKEGLTYLKEPLPASGVRKAKQGLDVYIAA
jgi:hypothetical protein